MSRRVKILLVLGVAAIAVAGAGLWALPEVVRRVALDQIPKLTGRAASIEDIDLNLLTGTFAIKTLRLAEREGPDAFVEFERLEGRLALPWLILQDIRFRELRLVAPTIRVIRAGPAEFNFSDLLARLSRADPAAPPSRWTYTLDHAAIERGRFIVEDHAVSPAADWSVQSFESESFGASTRPGHSPGRIVMRARLGTATVEIMENSVQLAPVVVSGTVKVTGVDLARLRPYLPPDVPAVPEAGTVALLLNVVWKREADRVETAYANGNVTVEGLALTQSDRRAPFATIERLLVGIKRADALAREITLSSVEVQKPAADLVRNADGTLDVIAALRAAPAAGDPAPAADAAAPPEPATRPAPPWTVRLERLSVTGGRLGIADNSVAPRREWSLDGLTVDGADLSTAAADPPGKLAIKVTLMVRPGASRPATLALDADSLRLDPLTASARLSVASLDLAGLTPYLPPTLPAAPTRGLLAIDLATVVEEDHDQAKRLEVSGSMRLTDAAVAQRGAGQPFLGLTGVAVTMRQADALTGVLDLESVEIDGPEVRAVRDEQGLIDLLALKAAPPRAPSPPPAAGPAPAAPAARRPLIAAVLRAIEHPWKIKLDRFAMRKGTATFEDRTTAPDTVLTLTDLTVAAERVTWPAAGPATFTVSTSMPGGGRTEIKGTAVIDPLDAQIAISTRDAPIEPYQAYFPFAARFVGFFSGDSLNELKMEDGVLRAASRGTGWARDFEIRAPGVEEPVGRVARMEIRNIDFSWPNYALVERVTITRPRFAVEREADGAINFRRLFEVKQDGGEAPAAPPAGPAPPASTGSGGAEAAKPNLLQTIVLDFREIAIEDGYMLFLDRTTTPAFSQDLSRLGVTVRDLSNVLGRQRTTMTSQAIVGGDAALELAGELSGIGESLRADLRGEIRDFSLPSANPYADSFIAWIFSRGKLAAKIHYQIEGDVITAEHEVLFDKLEVAPARQSDEVKKRLGLPLGLIVALLKDTRGDITLSLPLKGTLSDRSFDWGETIWAGVKQAILKLLAGPFRAIGRIFTGGDDKVDALQVNPVTFGAGSAVIAPEMVTHLTRVGDFLRRSPYIKLALAPVATASDVERLKDQELTARIQELQRQRQLPDFAAALTAYFKERGLAGPEAEAGAKPPHPAKGEPRTDAKPEPRKDPKAGAKASLPPPEEQLARLRELEPVPELRVQELLERRLASTREALVREEGIPAERLVTGEPQRLLDKRGDGRVEFSIAAE